MAVVDHITNKVDVYIRHDRPLTVIVKVQRALFLLPSSAVYVMLLLPMGRSTGGTSAGMTVTVGWKPELSTAAGTRHSTCPTLSSLAVSASMLVGQTITGAVTSADNNGQHTLRTRNQVVFA